MKLLHNLLTILSPVPTLPDQLSGEGAEGLRPARHRGGAEQRGLGVGGEALGHPDTGGQHAEHRVTGAAAGLDHSSQSMFNVRMTRRGVVFLSAVTPHTADRTAAVRWHLLQLLLLL